MLGAGDSILMLSVPRAKAICSSVNFDFFIQDDLLTEILPQN
jgi:hypothetical protein